MTCFLLNANVFTICFLISWANSLLLQVPIGAKDHPLFGSLRTDGLDLETLAGASGMSKILRPAELSRVAAKIQTTRDAVMALRECVHCCTLLANQADLVRNSYCLRTSLIAHLFTQVLPLPLPATSPLADRCFWGSQKMTHDTQSAILHSLALLSRHFAAACLSLKATRTSDATRTVTFSCIAAIADAVLRVEATDVPSQLSLHYSGRAAGPVTPYGFDIGDFALESSTMMMIDPFLSTARTQVLDYFACVSSRVSKDHTIFKFDVSDEVGEGDASLIDQLCVQMGFARDAKGGRFETAGLYLTGQRRDVMDVYPELGVFRDIIFYFKLVMVPTADDLPELKRWSPMEAALTWTCRTPASGMQIPGMKKQNPIAGKVHMQVSGFSGKELRCAVKHGEKKKWSVFNVFSGGPKPRCPPSGRLAVCAHVHALACV